MTKTLLRVLAGEAVWPPPVWMLRQAGRYLPEYRKTRAQAGDMVSLCLSPALATEVTLQPLRRYHLDASILFSDIFMLSLALGHPIDYREGEGPVMPPIRDAASVAALDPTRLVQTIAPILETVSRIKAALHHETLIGFAASPFTLACYLVEGHGSKEFAAARIMAHAQPELFSALIDIITDATIVYLDEQIKAGAEVAMLFDSWAGILSPTQFRRHVIAPTTRIVAALRARHQDVPVIGFPRLAGMLVGEYSRDTGIQGVSLDTAMDPAMANRLVPQNIAVQGNLDPLALVAGGQALYSETATIMKTFRGRPHIMNLGHGIVPQTNPDHVSSFIDQVRAA